MISEYILKRGETGSLMEFTLKDANGAVNLNEWVVTVTARDGDAEPVLEDEPCTLLPNQPAQNKGKGYYTFTSETSVIPAGSYDLEFKGIAPNGAIFYFPKSREKRFARLLVIESLES